MILGVILARGGSKRLPHKNMLPFCGHPLVTWTISAARMAGCLDEIIVSSDDDEILRIARLYGADILKRPKALATSEMSSYPPLLHAIGNAKSVPDYAVLLQPTSPLRLPGDIHACTAMAVMNGAAACVSFEEGKDVPNGAVYVGNVQWLRDGGNFDGPAPLKYRMPAIRSFDINTKEEFDEAEKAAELLIV